ncbi:type IV pilus biogenesis/stability protein PilW [Halomonas sp. E19]|uniref:type IV pilus biogenesis/stability protein PilW n=1 Tax=unclassified Halomonas TaxID=2609666 RepID=UPI004034C558
MTRFPWLPSRRTPLPLVAIVAGSLWLGGCAAQPEERAGAAHDPAAAFTELGIAYLERNNLARAMAALDRALQFSPDNPEALQAMAIVYQRQGEHALADSTFQRALQADPGFSRARNNYAAFLYSRGQVEKACRQLEQASHDTQYASRAQLFVNLGQCQWEMGHVPQARQSLERAKNLDPRSPAPYFMLAELELAQGNLDAAQQQLNLYIRLAGMTPDAQALARDIARAGGDTRLVTPGPDGLR